MATFTLVHGAWHGAWCCEALIAKLEARDHVAVAMNLPRGQPSATFDDSDDSGSRASIFGKRSLSILLSGLACPGKRASVDLRNEQRIRVLPPVPGVDTEAADYRA